MTVRAGGGRSPAAGSRRGVTRREVGRPANRHGLRVAARWTSARSRPSLPSSAWRSAPSRCCCPALTPPLVADFPEAARKLAAAFWPGPLTIAVPRRDDLPRNLTQQSTVAVRVPDHAAARAVIAAAVVDLAVTSANRSDEPPACTVEDAIAALGEHVALYLDGGPCSGGVPSTVITLEAGEPHVLRRGPIHESALRAALGLRG